MTQTEKNTKKKMADELSDKDLELVIGGIMSEVVIRETMENIKRFAIKNDLEPPNRTTK